MHDGQIRSINVRPRTIQRLINYGIVRLALQPGRDRVTEACSDFARPIMRSSLADWHTRLWIFRNLDSTCG
jgi:hypothetical protein